MKLCLLIQCTTKENEIVQFDVVSERSNIGIIKDQLERFLGINGMSSIQFLEGTAYDEIVLDDYKKVLSDLYISMDWTYIDSSNEPYQFFYPKGVLPMHFDSIGYSEKNEKPMLSYRLIEDDYAKYCFQIIVNDDTLWEVFHAMIGVINPIEALDVFLTPRYDYLEDKKTEIWRKIDSKLEILSFLEENTQHLIENGFLMLSVGARTDTPKIMLGAYKELILYTDSERDVAKVKEILEELNFEEETNKYFPPKLIFYRSYHSFSKEQMGVFLTKEGFIT